MGSDRVSRILGLVMKNTGDKQVRLWLRAPDRNGEWTKMVREYWDKAQEHPKFPEMSARTIDKQIALVVGIKMLDAARKVRRATKSL